MSELGDLFGVEEEPKVVHPTEKLLPYTRPDGRKMDVRVVGHHVLWANYLWNGAHWMSDYICTHPSEFTNKTVLELGAGAGLPSVLATEAGTKNVICTDYPDAELIENIQKNIDSLVKGEGKISALGYLWGSDPRPVLVQNDNQQYDIIIMCDVIFNHSEHGKLIQSIKDCLKPDGLVWCVFSHYRPWYMDRDLALLGRVRDELGMRVDFVESVKYDELIIEDKRGDPEIMKTVFAYRFTYPIEGEGEGRI